MYGTTTAGTGALNGAFGSILAAGITGLVVYLLFMLLGICVGYLILKAAVRNGAIEAIRKTGLDTHSSSFVNGFPPAQDVGAPPAPTYRGYGG